MIRCIINTGEAKLWRKLGLSPSCRSVLAIVSGETVIPRLPGIKRKVPDSREEFLDYRVEFLGDGADTTSMAFFAATDDANAVERAQILYRARRLFKGFKLRQKDRLVYSEPPQPQ
jgi:hypothetical protein